MSTSNLKATSSSKKDGFNCLNMVLLVSNMIFSVDIPLRPDVRGNRLRIVEHIEFVSRI